MTAHALAGESPTLLQYRADIGGERRHLRPFSTSAAGRYFRCGNRDACAPRARKLILNVPYIMWYGKNQRKGAGAFPHGYERPRWRL